MSNTQTHTHTHMTVRHKKLSPHTSPLQNKNELITKYYVQK